MTDRTQPRWFRAWRRFWEPPDEILVQAGVSGERVVARIRLLVTGALLGIPIGRLATGWTLSDIRTTVIITGIAFAMAIVFALVARGDTYRPWLGFVSSLADVTLISVTLVILIAVDQPHAAVNSRVIYPAYFLALAATALRYDARTCGVAGLLALGQYAAIVGYTSSKWDLNDPMFAPFEFGMFSWGAQSGRFILLSAASLIAIMIVLRTQRLRWLSASDPLTGLMNRGFFDERMAEEEIRSRRYDRPLSIAMIDIDRFKQFNDTYGHASGDEALRQAAQAIRDCLRRTDLVARYGGEEFVVAFLETQADAATTKAQDIRSAVGGQRVVLRGNRGVTNVTVSVGVASWPADGGAIRTVLEAADARLYAAKQAGRNRVAGPTGVISPQADPA